jgi:hypothetical protein
MARNKTCPHCGKAIFWSENKRSCSARDPRRRLPRIRKAHGSRDNGLTSKLKISKTEPSQAGRNEQLPQTLRTPWIFKSPDYNPPDEASPAQIAAAELHAARTTYHKLKTERVGFLKPEDHPMVSDGLPAPKGLPRIPPPWMWKYERM